MDKRYQVFVSSTFTDLQEERKAVMQALLSLDHFPAGMELFPASDDDQWALIKGVIDDSDYYVLVIGGRYGSTSETGISYTEMEYDYSLNAKIPILSFVHKSPDTIPSGKTDQDDALRKRLELFKTKVAKSKVVKFWSNPDELQAQVILSISAETKRNPQVGWVRANKTANPAIVESLRQQVELMKLELQSAKVTPPESSEKYAQGADEIKIKASFERPDSGRRYGIDVNTTWDRIFFDIGPLMMDEASEQALKDRIAAEIPYYADAKFPANFEIVKISDQSFDTIKIQFMTLGLIAKSSKPHPPNHGRYWSLTPYGEAQMTKLRAVLR